ncbi:uncharacterized protein LOC125941048 [Dermacentor silvarum]|uniref:uncharacterized protein LOC125941048 n=1 Tax=Dermacentor silvarum TaxID=543639 RepID=UPI002100C5B1|nr:uncharacterized protein LOC125941048 [Dermacentor silvarum]
MANAAVLQDKLKENDTKALFLSEQLSCLNTKHHKWSEATIRQAVLWHAKSPCGYEILRESGCLTLPSRSTLKRYIGACRGEVVSSLIKQRLHQESTFLTDREKKGSLVVDEMSIKQVATYEKKADRVHGLVEMGGLEKALGMENELATHLLAFVFVGLSTHYTIPVGYYFTRSTTGEQLHHLTMRVIRSVEDAGFEVVRLVADNHSSNCRMFSILSNGAIQPVVPHPMNDNRRLFLAFDHCHILKNVRNQLLAPNRFLCNGGEYYSPKYLRMLVDIIERQNAFKLVRRLTRKHVFPTNFEKMNVRRALDVFSPEVTATLRYLQQYGRRFGVLGFEDSLPTIRFMEMIHKWFTIHNIRSTTFYVITRDPDRMPFSSCDDDRLSWLENEFLPFFAAWKETAPDKRAFISLETYEALQITTRSTVESTKFLLRSGFVYVLTAKFSSDPVEALFSTVRQLNGSNDQTDARAALSSLQKVLAMGIIHSSASGSTERTVGLLGSCHLPLSLQTAQTQGTTPPSLPSPNSLEMQPQQQIRQLGTLPQREENMPIAHYQVEEETSATVATTGPSTSYNSLQLEVATPSREHVKASVEDIQIAMRPHLAALQSSAGA